MPATTATRFRPFVGASAIACALLWLAAPRAVAETSWVSGEVKLNVRTGAGLQFRIIDMVKTGDPVTIVSRGEDWVLIALENGKQGWIPKGYLVTEAPPAVRVNELDRRVAELEDRLGAATSESARLREENELLTGRDKQQRAEIDRLNLEVMELTAGARWPEWITGASIVGAGMILGAIMNWLASRRRPSSRIRL
jgi:SH3 domain protein